MNFPQFWARGRSGDFYAWRWSDQSQAEAQALADAGAKQLEARFDAGDYPEYGGGSYYPNRPAREQILREFKNEAGEVMAVVTRNSYGCQVLNTARVIFVDIDLPEPEPPGFFQRLFGKTAAPAAPEAANGAITRVEQWTRQHPEWGWRIYRTRAGLRLIATQTVLPADAAVVQEIFTALGADPLYQQLCKTQKCFRARLTPKPWRCGIRTKPARWPWLDAKAETRFKRWETQYQSFAAGWATCEFIRQIGNPAVHPEVQTIVQFHDEATRVEAKLKLA